jgi:hypothetical protein
MHISSDKHKLNIMNRAYEHTHTHTHTTKYEHISMCVCVAYMQKDLSLYAFIKYPLSLKMLD